MKLFAKKAATKKTEFMTISKSVLKQVKGRTHGAVNVTQG